MKCKSVFSRAFVLALLFLPQVIYPLLAQAQSNSSTIKGLVHAENNQPIVGASVIIRNRQTNFTLGTKTDTSGFFTAANGTRNKYTH